MEWVVNNVETPYCDELPEELQIALPSYEEQQTESAQVAVSNVADYFAGGHEVAAERARGREVSLLRQRHAGSARYPPLDDHGKLPRTTCTECGDSFASRNQLFFHLRRCYPVIVDGYHASHLQVQPPYGAASSARNTVACSAANCGVAFTGQTKEEAEAQLMEHLKRLGTPGVFSREALPHVPARADEAAAAAVAVPSADPKALRCLLCGTRPTAVMLLPCGHQAVCAGCVSVVFNRKLGCPICAGAITSCTALLTV
eukprot:TRINITY_DN1704_c0_g1_i4.p1 TRINITY_DN1704_c0_g1~~TRINITY_DN1704_c0_g1_i4.p1  ORF type:complete len:258 (-),score=56.38 TRINITY_DN1704_c0_g1_i4:73-846(-)